MDGKSHTSYEVGDKHDALAFLRFWNPRGEMDGLLGEWGMTLNFVLWREVPERLKLDDVTGDDNRAEPHPLLLAAFSSVVAAVVVPFPFPAIDGDRKKEKRRWKGCAWALVSGHWSLRVAGAKSERGGVKMDCIHHLPFIRQ